MDYHVRFGVPNSRFWFGSCPLTFRTWEQAMSETPWKRAAAQWHPLVCLMLLTGFAGLRAEPVIFLRAIVNAASFMPSGVPGGAIARGSIFTIFGRGMGPATSATVSVFPLQTTLEGVSIEVIQGAATVNAIPIFVVAGQLNVIMPSDAPLGRVTVRVTFNGEQSNPATVPVVDNSVGIFTMTGAGIGPGIVQNFVSKTEQPINTTTKTAKPGQVVTMWATGLGPIDAPDNTAPPVGTLPFGVEIVVGGKAVTNVLYAGRAPCCSGVDQFVFAIPADAPEGCYVPLRVRVAGVAVSNTVTIAIEGDQQRCSEPQNPAIETVLSGGTIGIVNMLRTVFEADAGVITPVAFTIDTASAYFSRETGGELAFNPLFALPPHGACAAYAFAGDLVRGIPFPYASSPGLDAGEITLNGPAGAAELERTVVGESTFYNQVTVGGPEGVSGDTDEPLFFSPGAYQIKGTGAAGSAPSTRTPTSPPRFNGRIRGSSARWRAAKESLSNGRRGTPLGLPSRA